MSYTRTAVERAMKVQEAIVRALSGRQSWLQVADVLGVSPRTARRVAWRYERDGYDGVCGGGMSGTVATGCSITGAAAPRPEPSRWPRCSASCACTGSATARATA